MSEYDLVCDACAKALDVADGVVSWRSEGNAERGFALTHAACVPQGATERVEVSRLLSPNGFLAFASARFGRRIAEPEPLRAIVWALAPAVMRHDNAVEMDAMRAASFGARLGVKPGTAPVAGTPHAPPAKETEAGK